jgi:arylsulfatase A-like enzyme
MNKPNIIIFNPDQWRSDVMGHLGNPAANTPNLDKFALQEAVSFRNAFCQNPVCTPSRCSFMTGWYPHVRGHRTMSFMLRDHEGEPNLLKILKQNGYLVWWGGKNDLIPGQSGYDDVADIHFRPHREDFERWKLTPQVGSHIGDMSWRGTPDSDSFFSFYRGKLDKGDEDVYCDMDWMMVLGAIDFLNNYSGEQPLCIYLPISYPHPPYCVEDPWYSLADRDGLPPRIKAPENWNQKPAILKGIFDAQGLQEWSESRWSELRATYYGMCSRVDHQFGLLTDTLREVGQFDNSAIFVLADHGDFTGDYGLVEKTQNTFEDCLTRVPFVVKPPQGTSVSPGVSDALVELTDFSATVYDYAGIEPDYSHFGLSLKPLIEGITQQHRDAVFCEGGRLYGESHASESNLIQDDTGLYYPRQKFQASDDGPYHTKAAMCRTKDFKYVKRYYERDELYDLTNDPQELHNVINDQAHRATLLSLKERMLDWYMSTCDVVPWEFDERW